MRDTLLFLGIFMLWLLPGFGTTASAQNICDTTGCNANDFISIDYRLADFNGNDLDVTGLQPGDPVVAYLWSTFSGNASRFNLLIYFDIIQDGVQTGNVNLCWQSPLPNNEIPVGQDNRITQITWNYGEELRLRNLYMGWQVNKNTACGCGNKSHCFTAATDYLVSAPLVARFDYSATCAVPGSNFQQLSFTSTTTGGIAPYAYNWTFDSGATPLQSTVANQTVSYSMGGTKTVSLEVTDGEGNTSVTSLLVTVDPCCDLVLAAPDDIAVECDGSILPAQTGSATATNNGLPVTATYTDVITPGSNDNEYTITRTWSVSDSCGTTLTDVQLITVSDNTPPVIACPDDLTVEPNDGVTYTGSIGTASATDNCDDSVVISSNAPSVFPLGATTVIWTATDASGNSSSCTQLVTVDDITPVDLTECAPDQVVDADENCSALVPDFTASLEILLPDDGNTYTVTQDPLEGSTLSGAGLHIITLTVTDQSGNSSNCEALLILNDVTAPVIESCAQDVTLSAGPDCQAEVPDFTANVVASDNCTVGEGLIFSQSPEAGTLTGLGETVVVITVTDEAGHSTSCSVTLTVEDNNAPVISECAADVTVSADENCQAVVPDLTGSVVVTENCNGTLGNYTISQSPAANTLVGTGNHTITITVTDDAGNSTECTAVFTVEDSTVPVLTVPADFAAGTNDECSYVGSIGTSTATDDCDPAVAIDNDAPASFPIGTTVVTWTATDASGNTSTGTQNVTISDDDAPVIAGCPDDLLIGGDENDEYAVPEFITELGITITENCGNQEDPGFTVTQSPAAGTILGLGSHTITITVTDDAGNSSVCTFMVTVEDLTPSDFLNCPPLMELEAIVCYDICTVIVPDLTKNLTFTDEIVSLVQEPAAGTWLEGSGFHAVTLTATDVSGNTSVCETGIYAYSVKIVGCAPQVVSLTEGCMGEVPDFTEDVTLESACGGDLGGVELTVVQSPAAGTSLAAGTHTVTLTVTNGLGHIVATCSTTLTVEDAEAPVVTCPVQTINIDLKAEVVRNRFGIYIVYKGYLPQNLATATDNCTPTAQLAFSYSQTTFTQADLGMRPVTVEVTDAAGNIGTCQFYVNVRMPLKSAEIGSVATQTDAGNVELLVNAYPNPTRGRLSVDIVNLNNPEVIATVYNLAGATVFESNYTTDGRIELDLSGREDGIYLLKIMADQKLFTTKVILESR